MKRQLIGSFCLPLLLVGCATGGSGGGIAADVVETTRASVAGCVNLGRVIGTASGGYTAAQYTKFVGVAREGALADSRKRAKEQADRMGATHIVWIDIDEGYTTRTTVVGEAYRCEQGR